MTLKGKKGTGTKKEYAPSVGLWPTKNGRGFSAGITRDVLEALNKAEEGGRIYLQEVPESEREDNDKKPHYRIVFFSAGEKAREQSETL